MPRPAWLIRSTRTRTVLSIQSRCRRTARFWWAAISASIGGQTRNRIARLDPTTGLADSFDPNANGAVYSIAVQADGKILVGGVFTEHRRTAAQSHRPARSHDRPGRFVQSERERSCLFHRGAGGRQDFGGRQFHAASADRRAIIARLDPTTGLADSFNPNANSSVASIAVQADGKILAGGDFTSIGGQTRNHIARLDPTTGLADSFDPNANGDVVSIAVQADGKILVGGDFTMREQHWRSSTRNHIARLETDGRLDQTLDLQRASATLSVATAVQPDGKILIGGTLPASWACRATTLPD